jgi:polysaccharide export outer membrane protein
MVRRFRTLLALLMLASPVAGGAQRPASGGGVSAPADALRPGDVVRLAIWREPDLSGEFTVDKDGTVMFPKIGAQRVTEVSPDSLRTALVAAYRVYLRNPSIDVTLLRRVNVLGAVQKPGLYPVDPTMTIADVIALAGGATSVGDPHKVELRRIGSTRTRVVAAATKLADSPLRPGDQLYVPERSWMARNPGVVIGAVSTLITIVAIFVQ